VRSRRLLLRGKPLDALDARNRNSLVCISKVPWGPWEEGDWESSLKKVEASGAEPILCEFRDEDEHRRFAAKEALRRGLCYVYIPDGDEIAEPKLVDYADKVAAERTYINGPRPDFCGSPIRS